MSHIPHYLKTWFFRVIIHLNTSLGDREQTPHIMNFLWNFMLGVWAIPGHWIQSQSTISSTSRTRRKYRSGTFLDRRRVTTGQHTHARTQSLWTICLFHCGVIEAILVNVKAEYIHLPETSFYHQYIRMPSLTHNLNTDDAGSHWWYKWSLVRVSEFIGLHSSVLQSLIVWDKYCFNHSTSKRTKWFIRSVFEPACVAPW